MECGGGAGRVGGAAGGGRDYLAFIRHSPYNSQQETELHRLSLREEPLAEL